MDEPMRPVAYEFGDFRVDVVKRSLLLRADGRPLPVSARAFDTLLFFLEHSGELLEKSTLMAAIWPKVVVEENNLNQHISALRRLLGERPEEHRFIVTVPGRGYRFVAAVHEVMQDTIAPTQAAAPVPPAASASLAPIGANANAREPADARDEATSSTATATAPARRPRLATLALITALAVAALLTGVYALWREGSGASVTSVRVEAPSRSGAPENVARTGAAAFSPPPHSIAVLPFVNLSGDKEQEYFSDGLTEELLNSLAHIDGLQVAARTSSFSFREHPDIADVAHKLNVAALLEGSVRRSGHTVRISTQLINAVTGFHLWSKTYDRDLGDVLTLQTEIATGVATAMEVTLLGDVGTKIELGGTRNPAAFDAYLRASKTHQLGQHDRKDYETAIAGYSEAIRLDPKYALAFAWRSLMWVDHAWLTYEPYAKSATIAEDDQRALADARQAVTLAPELAESHLALAVFFHCCALDFASAKAEFERAVALAPGNAAALRNYGGFAVMTGDTDAGIAATRRAVRLDPLNPITHYRLAVSLYLARRYPESVAAWSHVLALNPQESDSAGIRGLAYYALGDLQNARASCEARPDNEFSQLCLAITYQRLTRRADAENELAKLRVAGRWAYRVAEVYAQWGDPSQALESLESAWRARNPELRLLKADPLLDPLRKEPRFQVIERALKFPD
jgi:TolB-like protein/DNA-binding winged helix-turn-helix (wHTH) protein/tetratricopeptide (TPR) repeat protein